MLDRLKKIVEYVLIPIALIVAIFKLLNGSKSSESDRSMDEAKKTGEDLKKAEDDANQGAKEAMAQADELAKQAEEVRKEGLDLDWHKRR